MALEFTDKIYVPSLVAPSGGEISTHHIRIGDTYSRTFAVVQYPREVSINWLGELLNLKIESRIAIYVEGMDNSKIRQMLNKKFVENASNNIVREQQGMVKDFESEVLASDLESMMHDLAEGTDKIVRVHFFITISAPDKKMLEDLSEIVERKLASLNIDFRILVGQAYEGFVSSMFNPSPVGEMLPYSLIPASSTASMFPFSLSEFSDEYSSDKDIRIFAGLNTATGTLVFMDVFKNQNGNTIVLGKTRSGKSYFVKDVVAQLVMQDVDVVVVDPMSEYGMLAEALNEDESKPNVVTLSIAGKNHINPFDIYKFSDEDFSITFAEKIAYIENLVQIMLEGELTQEERSILSKAIVETYRKKGFTEKHPGKTPPTFRDLFNELSTGEEFADFSAKKQNAAQVIASKLARFVDSRGKYASFFSSQTNVDPSNQMIVFDVSGITNENTIYRDIGFYMILRYLWDRIRKKPPEKKIVIVIDEARLFMINKQIRQEISDMIAKIAKYNAAIYLISQSVKDFGTVEGMRIVGQSGLKVLFSLDPTEVDEMGDIFKLKNQEKNFITMVRKGYALFIREDLRAGVKIIADPAINSLITTNPGEWKEWGS